MSVLKRLSATVEALRPEGRLLLGIDGPDAAGKTTFSRDLRQALRRSALSVSIDFWHQPRALRMHRGDESPEGYYYDSFDLQALAAELLVPFQSGARVVRTAHYDHIRDRPMSETAEVAADAVLIVDGVFLLRPELRPHWDLVVYLDVPEAVTLQRAVRRDRALMGGEAAVRRRYEVRYLPGQLHYRTIASPLEIADIVIDNTIRRDPRIRRWADG